jgi:hypothetical protein
MLSLRRINGTTGLARTGTRINDNQSVRSSRLDGRNDLQVEIAFWVRAFLGNFVTMIPLAAWRFLLLSRKGFFAISWYRVC